MQCMNDTALRFVSNKPIKQCTACEKGTAMRNQMLCQHLSANQIKTLACLFSVEQNFSLQHEKSQTSHKTCVNSNCTYSKSKKKNQAKP